MTDMKRFLKLQMMSTEAAHMLHADTAVRARQSGLPEPVRREDMTPGLPTFEDRVIGTQITRTICQSVDVPRSDLAVEVRTWNSVHSVAGDVAASIADGFVTGFQTAFRGCFENLPHAAVLREVMLALADTPEQKRASEIVGSRLRDWVDKDAVQGCALSPIRANLAATPVDRADERLPELRIWRHVNDILVLAKATEAGRVSLGTAVSAIFSHVRLLGSDCHPDKTKMFDVLDRPHHEWGFLGRHFKVRRKKCGRLVVASYVPRSTVKGWIERDRVVMGPARINVRRWHADRQDTGRYTPIESNEDRWLAAIERIAKAVRARADCYRADDACDAMKVYRVQLGRLLREQAFERGIPLPPSALGTRLFAHLRLPDPEHEWLRAGGVPFSARD